MTQMAELEIGNELLAWAETALRLHEVAESLCRSSFVPVSFKKAGRDTWRPKEDVVSDVVATILAGDEVGLRPLAALRSVQLVSGTPAMTALAMRGLVQANGHEVWIDGEPTDTKAVVLGVRRGSDKVNRSVWTIERAQKMGLTSKSQWSAQPMAMLVARATSECCRLTASDVLLGMPYSIEELADGDVAAQDPTPATPRKARRAPLASVPEPPLEEPTAPALEDESQDPPEPPVVDPDAATDAQLSKLAIQFDEAGYTDRDDKLRYLTNVFGREITSSRDLSKSEASFVIDAFEAGTTLGVGEGATS